MSGEHTHNNSTSHERDAVLRAALHRIATEGDALSGRECQEIAAEALGIPIPHAPTPPRTQAPDDDLARRIYPPDHLGESGHLQTVQKLEWQETLSRLGQKRRAW